MLLPNRLSMYSSGLLVATRRHFAAVSFAPMNTAIGEPHDIVTATNPNLYAIAEYMTNARAENVHM